MFSLKSIVLIAAVFVGAECSAVVPAVAAAPLVAPAHVGYAHAVPQNIPPYASQINVVSKAISPVIAAAPVAAAYTAPIAAPVAAPLATPFAAPFAARFAPAGVAAPLAVSPYFASPSVLPAAYAAAPYGYPASFAAPAAYAAPSAYAAPYPYAAPAPLVRAPYGVAPAFVR